MAKGYGEIRCKKKKKLLSEEHSFFFFVRFLAE